MSLRRFIDGKNQFARDIDEIDDEGMKEINTNLFAGIALDIILSDNPNLAIVKRLNSLEDTKNHFLAKIKKIAKIKEKIKSGEVSGTDGFRELLKIIEEGE